MQRGSFLSERVIFMAKDEVDIQIYTGSGKEKVEADHELVRKDLKLAKKSVLNGEYDLITEMREVKRFYIRKTFHQER